MALLTALLLGHPQSVGAAADKSASPDLKAHMTFAYTSEDMGFPTAIVQSDSTISASRDDASMMGYSRISRRLIIDDTHFGVLSWDLSTGKTMKKSTNSANLDYIDDDIGGFNADTGNTIGRDQDGNIYIHPTLSQGKETLLISAKTLAAQNIPAESGNQPFAAQAAWSMDGNCIALSFGSHEILDNSAADEQTYTYVFNFATKRIRKIGKGYPYGWISNDRIVVRDWAQGDMLIVYSLTGKVLAKRSGFIDVATDGKSVLGIVHRGNGYAAQLWSSDLKRRLGEYRCKQYHPHWSEGSLVLISIRNAK
jgi:hypothetical protein